MNLWTIASVEFAQHATEESPNWAGSLLLRLPKAGTHNSTNYIFVSEPSSYTGQVLQLPTDLEAPLTQDQQALTVAKWLLQEDRSIPILLTKSECSTLSKHCAWKLWCFEYKDKDPRTKADWVELGKILTELRPDLASQWPEYKESYTSENIRQIIRTALVDDK